MKEILLSQQGKNKGKFVALVDDSDYERVNQFRWFVSIEAQCCYAKTRVKNEGKITAIAMHRFILNTPAGVQTDHRDVDGLNNQRSNLRNCTNQQNQMNRRSAVNKTSKYKGVSLVAESKKWLAQIQLHKVIYIGIYSNEIEAAKAYDKKAVELFGEFAYLNFKT